MQITPDFGVIVLELETGCFHYVRQIATFGCVLGVNPLLVNKIVPFFAFFDTNLSVFRRSPTGGHWLTGEAVLRFRSIGPVF